MLRAVERLDGLVGGIGLLIVVAALGVAMSASPAASQVFRVGFPEQRASLPAQTGSIAGDGSQELRVAVGAANLTRLEFTLSVHADGPRVAGDTIVATLRHPDGRSEQKTGTLAGPGTAADASLSFAENLTAAPPEQAVRAPGPVDALAQEQGLASSNGTGTWSLTVAIAGQAGVGAVHAESHALRLETAAVSYQAVVLPGQVDR